MSQDLFPVRICTAVLNMYTRSLGASHQRCPAAVEEALFALVRIYQKYTFDFGPELTGKDLVSPALAAMLCSRQGADPAHSVLAASAICPDPGAQGRPASYTCIAQVMLMLSCLYKHGCRSLALLARSKPYLAAMASLLCNASRCDQSSLHSVLVDCH